MDSAVVEFYTQPVAVFDTPQLRDYQESLIAQTRASIRNGSRAPLLVSPCGSGKTIIFSYFSGKLAAKQKRVLILAHRVELLDQISKTLDRFKVTNCFIAPGKVYSTRPYVNVGSVFSVARRLEEIPAPDYIIIDEAHHATVGSTWGKVLARFPHAIRIGVTATPRRLSGEALGDIFDDLIIGPSIPSLQEMGALSKYRLFAPPGIDTSGIHTRMGDYARNELTALVDRPTITGSAVLQYQRFAHGKRAIVYCCSVEHARNVATEFQRSGYSAKSLDGTMEALDRSRVVMDFRQGEIQILTSVDIVSEGFDLPAIECAIMLRPTQSLGLWLQQSGRALRPYPGKEAAIILDHAGNCQLHGMPCETHAWSLEGKVKRRSKPVAGVRICAQCFGACRSRSTVCGYCNTEFPLQPREVAYVEGDLEQIKKIERHHRNKEQAMARDFPALIALGKARNYPNPFGWAQNVLRARARGRR